MFVQLLLFIYIFLCLNVNKVGGPNLCIYFFIPLYIFKHLFILSFIYLFSFNTFIFWYLCYSLSSTEYISLQKTFQTLRNDFLKAFMCNVIIFIII